MVKISKTKHVTKKGVVKRNPVSAPLVPMGVNYLADEEDENGNWTGGYDSEGADYYTATQDMSRIIRKQFKALGLDFLPVRTETDLDIKYTFIYKGKEHKVTGTKHLYGPEPDETINHLWNWSFYPSVPQSFEDKIIGKIE